jgi:glycosyltransferase involved in cell wall biosynthesis
MEILFLTPELPYPAHSGGTIKTAALLAHLRTQHRVHLICFTRRPPTAEQARWVDKHGPADLVSLNRERTAANLVASYLSAVPLSVHRNRSREMATLVSRAIHARVYGAVFVDGWLMAQYLPARMEGVKLLHQHNAEHVMWRRHVDLEHNPIRRALLRLESQRVRRYEAAILPRFDTVFAVSQQDRRRLASLGAEEAHLRVLPNVAEGDLLDRPPLSPERTGPTILFLGTLSWEPNLVGLEAFLRAVLPRIREKLPGARFVIAGRGGSARLAQLAVRAQGVDLVGPVDDPEPLYRRAHVFVDVSLGGAGSRVKVLNAMARGLPVIATPSAAEGLEAVPGEQLLVAEDPGSFADAIVRVMSDPGLWTNLSRRGRLLVRERYVPERAFLSLDEVLTDAALADGRPS